ncbi:hypothetical protein MBLNU459_g2716t1 [Dothideomycetes sp. NU459]
MDPAELQRTDSLPQMDGGSPTVTAKALQTPVSTTKAGKTTAAVARIDTEPIYTQLKAAVGDGWADYKTALSAFILGKLDQAELSHTLLNLLSHAPSVSAPAVTSAKQESALVSTLHLHNTLISALYANIFRDPPPETIASWVLATDAPASHNAAKANGAPGAGDKAEERLKREVMALSARDRRRIKNVSSKDASLADPVARPGPLQDNLAYATALTVPITANAATEGMGAPASSLSKTNWDLEIRRRYAMPLAAETLEFPSRGDIQARIEPICYEEGVGLTSATPLSSTTLASCAELVETAAEMFVKELLVRWLAATRSNGEHQPTTAKYRKQLRKEEEAFEQGKIARTSVGLLPCEAERLAHAEPLSMDEVRLALRLDDGLLRQDPFLAERILENVDDYGVPMDIDGDGEHELNGFTNGVHNDNPQHEDLMAIDSDGWGWSGAANSDRDVLMGVLDSALTVGY